MIYEVLILMIIAPSYFLQQYSPTHLPTIAYQNQPCRKWDWVAVCNTSNFTYGATSGIAGLSALYILWYASYIVRAYMELRKRPCTEVRAASMLLSLQVSSLPCSKWLQQMSACHVCMPALLKSVSGNLCLCLSMLMW